MSAKSRMRRQELLTAASRVISEHGIARASVRSVAEHAEVSPGSVLYHFESFDQLVAEAVRGVVEEFGERRRRRAEGIADPVERLRALIESGIPERISDELRVVYEAAATIRQRPQSHTGLMRVWERQVALYRSAIEVGVALGAFRPRMEIDAIAENLIALEDAYDLYLLDPDNRQRERFLRNTLLFAETVLDCELRAEGRADADPEEDA